MPGMKTQNDAIDTPPGRQSRGVVVALVSIVIVCIAVWSSSFGGVILFDGIENIILNESVHDIASLGWLKDGRRPVTNLTFALNWSATGEHTGPFHAVNLLIHLVTSLGIFALVRLAVDREGVHERWRGRSALLGAFIALLWLVHPLQTQSVTYIVQRAESLAGMWYVLTLLTAAIGIRREDRSRSGSIWFVLAVLCCALGMGSKAVAVTAPVIVLVWDAVFGAGTIIGAIKRRWTLYAALAMTWAVVLLLGVLPQVFSTDVERTVGFGFRGASASTYLFTQTHVLWHYIRLSLWPDALCIDYGWPFVGSIGPAIVPGLALTLIFLASVFGVVRGRWWGFAGAIFFVVLAPTSSVIPIADAAMEHRMYLPLLGIVALGVVGLFAILDRFTGGKPALIAVPMLGDRKSVV